MEPQIDRENRIWLAFKGGEDAAFDRLYDALFDLLFRYGCKLTDDRELVKDALQGLFIRVWNRRSQISITTSVRHYLLISLKRDILHARKRQDAAGKRALRVVSKQEPYTPSPEADIVLREHQDQRVAKLQLALRRLSRREREAVFLRYYADMSHEEAASIMQLQPNSLYNLISRAVGKLRKLADR
jgi:RNA polymerase sigma factor (sigma-70 family)